MCCGRHRLVASLPGVPGGRPLPPLPFCTHLCPHPTGFGERATGEAVTTTALIKALAEHIGKPLQLRVARPGDVVETVTVVAVEAGDVHH